MFHDLLPGILNFGILAGVFVLSLIVDVVTSRKRAVTPLDPTPIRETVLLDNASRERSASRTMERWLSSSQAE